ncbi:MAG: hypothetical protein ABIT01_03280 [Thermoanaerobaculia bacterium]
MPGAIGTAAWTLPSVASAVTESELLLSLDGGLTFPIRLTRDLDIDTSRVRFRVPNLPTDRARLALRVGFRDRGEEIIETIGPEFSIGHDDRESLEPLARVRGEWRTQDALDEDRDASPGSSSLGGTAGSVSALLLTTELDEPQRAEARFSEAIPNSASRRSGAISRFLPAPLCRRQVSRPKRE